MLNQSDVKNNNNKFYVIQLLQNAASGQYVVWNRWGRVGVVGQSSAQSCGSNLRAAKALFANKFSDKTGNAWQMKKHFQKLPGKYHLIEMDYEVSDECPSKCESSISHEPSILPPRVQSLVKLIGDIDMMKRQMIEVGYDAKKMPLGKISKTMIKEGYNILKCIGEELSKTRKNSKTLEDLSSRFYTVIPHNFGFQSMRNFIISTPDKLKEKILMVEALESIEVAHRLLDSKSDAEGENPVDSKYKQLKCDMRPLEEDSADWKMVEEYIKNTHASTHGSYHLKLNNLFSVDREGEAERFAKFASDSNRMLLWHGSRLTNWMGILSHGLRIAPPEAPVTGYMFGKGVYFADMVSKSANYCFASRDSTRAVMLLCEVALGKSNELQRANYHADQLREGCLSTHGQGRTAPDPAGMRMLPDGVKVPLGASADTGVSGSLLYNEFIVYDTAQIRMRYVMEVEFQFK
eukprot:TRINITY_DN6553_c0_g2_i2.p1 TRINITY_DN6553_c0_g2~~TRINITY_DN6553_c0_g2_i2.p1  ORF type:complete len:462 (+),score=108.00 TRINITY_DN6553_c0_g2_i2:362-1747(+)